MNTPEFESNCILVALAVGMKYSEVVKYVAAAHEHGRSTRLALLTLLEDKMK